MQNRIDGLLARNRNNALLDIALGAFLIVVVAFTGISFGSQLPKLSSSSRPAPAMLADTNDAAPVTGAQASLAVSSAPDA